MVRIAEISVALGVAVMIVTLAVIMGFKREVTRKIVGFGAHVAVTDVGSVHAPDGEPVRRTPHLERLLRRTEGFVSMSPYVLKSGVVKTRDAVVGLLLKGVDASYDGTFFRECLEEGELPRTGDSVRTKDLLVSRATADLLCAGVGDRVEMLFVGEDAAPRRDRFRISGIYRSGMEELDRTVALTDLRNVQRLWDWDDDRVTGYEIRLDGLEGADGAARRLKLQPLSIVAAGGIVRLLY